jgi:hypothetical protein
MRGRAFLLAPLAAAGCLFGGGSERDASGGTPSAAAARLRCAVAYLPRRTPPDALKEFLPGASWIAAPEAMEPLELRARLAAVAPEAVVLLEGVPRFTLRIGERPLLSDAPYEDLDGDGRPETPVVRIGGPAETVRATLERRAAPSTVAALVGRLDPRVHAEARLLTEWLAGLGYTVSTSRPSGPGWAVEPGAFLPLVWADREPVAGLRCWFTEGWEIPARYNNEMVERLLDAHRRRPDATLAQLLVEARGEFLRGHPAEAERLAELLRGSRVPESAELRAGLAWEAFGPPDLALLPCGPAALPFRRPETATLAQSPLLGSWSFPLDLADDEELPVLRLHFETPPDQRDGTYLIVEQSGEQLYRIACGALTRRSGRDPLDLGGYVCGNRYRGRFLLPLREHSRSTVVVRVEGGAGDRPGFVRLQAGSAVEIWKFGAVADPVARPPESGGTTRESASAAAQPRLVRGTVAVARAGASRFLLVDLSGLLNRPYHALEVGTGSFASWFEGERVEHRKVPFRVERKVLVSPNDTQCVFAVEGLSHQVRRIHLLVWGYGYPKALVPLVLRFEDGNDREVTLALQEWTQADPPPAFDFNHSAGYAHASIYHETIDVPRDAKLVGIESREGQFGLVAMTLEE